jgi:mono/diheme cytochrome c family protein
MYQIPDDGRHGRLDALAAVITNRLTFHLQEGLAISKIREGSVHSMKSIIAIVAILVAVGVGYAMWPAASHTPADTAAASLEAGVLEDVLVPETLSQNAQIGQLGYDAKCSACHGANAAGQDGVAPPLVHIIYEPSHHGDEAFQRAATMGVRGHHWPFGDMPAVEGVTRGDVTMIIAYIRELQRANGIN